ncbi:ABC transporter ATP-binding protein [Thalassobacillus hwangdonensis]|uniref:ABC transporter ATP-binding protein n=1 Tax=Thalassobacillus hwangdonensis TaxID=546108 RepID=A0ABW3L0F0_9BACI
MQIEFKNLTKAYGAKKALNNFSLTLEANKIYGLLGRNGAGKTTMMQLLAGQISPTSGEVLVNGEKPFNNRTVLEDICLINESNNFKRRLKIKHVLKIASLFYPKWSQETADRLMKTFKLESNLNMKGLSKGMESSVGIIIGLASRANITIFDEPYIGLDASARYDFYDALLEEFQQHPRTIILSTHLIDEVSNLFEEIILVREGELMHHKTSEEMTELSIQVTGPKDKVDAFCTGKNVIHTDEIMGRKTVIVFGEHFQLEDLKNEGLEAERCPIQKLMVHLTEEKGVRTHV